MRGVFRKSPLASGCALAATALIAHGAGAQPAKPTRAEAVFREGREAIARGDRKAGCAKIAESVRLARAAGPLLNLADCEETDGHLVAALGLWREGLSALEPRDDRRPYAKERAAKLAAKVPTLAVRVVPEVAGALIEIDGEAVPLDEARSARPVDPGAHTIIVKADGQAGRAEITLALGEQREATVTLSPEPPLCLITSIA